VASLDEAWKAAGDVHEISIIGGTSLFEETLPIADRIHLTEVQAEVAGDTFFPKFDRSGWRETEVSRHPADAKHAYPFRIVVLDRDR
jgi:dihydrofolate reductase